MLQKRFNFFTIFINGLFFTILGCSLILHHMEPWDWVYLTFTLGMYAIAGLRFVNLMMNFKKLSKRFMVVLDIILWLALGIISSLNPYVFRLLLPRIVGCWLLLHTIVKAIVLYIKIENKISGQFRLIVLFFFDLTMTFIMLFQPNKQTSLISNGVGIYLLIYGISMLWEFIREVIPRNSGTKLDQKIRLAVPPFLAAIIPPTLMHTILDRNDDEIAMEYFEVYKSNVKVDLEVLIHLAASGPARLGHMDIVYKNYVMSYGCYDPHLRRLGGTLGDGVILVSPRNPYIKNCLENENKILVSFGISLNDEQRYRMEKKLKQMEKDFVEFNSDEQLYQKGLLHLKQSDDYLSRVTRNIKEASFYKTKDDRLKTFFVLSNNCVYFASQVLQEIGLNLFDLSGIISPGAYYDFLNNQFKSDKSFVISRKVYRKKDARNL